MSAFRSIAERISTRIVLHKRLPVEFGHTRVYVTPDSSLRFWVPGWRADHADLLRYARKLVRRGSVVWDIGANVGVFSLAAAWLAGHEGKVVSVEPDPALIVLLTKSIHEQASCTAEIWVIFCAVADRWDLTEFNIVRRGRSSNYLTIAGGGSQTGGVREKLDVATVPLDALLQRVPAPDVLKIDVEGAEHLVLKGATRILSDVRPTILCEVLAKNRDEVKVIFECNRYEMFDADSDMASPISSPAYNTLARPL